MPVTAQRKATEIIAGWRRIDEADGQDNPAGPLFPSGDHAEQELTMTGGSGGLCGSNCTWSCIGGTRNQLDCC